VLIEGGTVLFNAWDRIELNPQAQVASAVMDELFPGDAEMQFAKIPYSFHDEAQIRALLDEARFADVRVERAKVAIHAPTARAYATGQIRGTPRGALIEQKGRKVDEVIERIADALAKLGGAEPFHAEGNVLVVQAKAI
jgi:hypothetical protein